MVFCGPELRVAVVARVALDCCSTLDFAGCASVDGCCRGRITTCDCLMELTPPAECPGFLTEDSSPPVDGCEECCEWKSEGF